MTAASARATGHPMQPSLREIWTRKLIYPGHTLPTAIAPVIVGIGLAVRDGVFAPLPAGLAFLAGWLIQFAGVVVDNHENLVRQPDDREHPELVEAVRTGLLSLRQLQTTALACYALAATAGVWLWILAGWPVVVIGLASMAASYLYAAGPLPIGRLGLADPLFFLFFGVVSVVGTYYVQAASVLGPERWVTALPASAFAAGVPLGALITDILIIDDIRDRDHDSVKGKNTVAVRFGKRWSRLEHGAWLGVAYLAPFALWRGLGLGVYTLLPLLSAPLALWIAREVWRRDDYAALLPMTPRMAQLGVLYAVLLAVGLAAGGAG